MPLTFKTPTLHYVCTKRLFWDSSHVCWSFQIWKRARSNLLGQGLSDVFLTHRTRSTLPAAESKQLLRCLSIIHTYAPFLFSQKIAMEDGRRPGSHRLPPPSADDAGWSCLYCADRHWDRVWHIARPAPAPPLPLGIWFPVPPRCQSRLSRRGSKNTPSWRER